MFSIYFTTIYNLSATKLKYSKTIMALATNTRLLYKVVIESTPLVRNPCSLAEM